MKEEYAIGIDVGGSSLKCGLVNKQGKVSYSFVIPLEHKDTAEDVMALMSAAIRKCVTHRSVSLRGIGIGFPGIVIDNVVIGGADNLPVVTNFHLGDVIHQSTGLPVVVDNDAHMMAWGEKQFGVGKNATDMVFLTVGTGIGGSLILHNELYGGYQNRGTEMGHIVIQFDGKKCACGAHGCFEAYASTRALLEDYTTRSGLTVDGKQLVARYLSEDQYAVESMQQHFDYLAVGIVSLVNIFSPQKVIIGGGLSESGDFYIHEIRKRVAKMAMPDTIVNTEILRAALGNQAGILGCAARVFEQF